MRRSQSQAPPPHLLPRHSYRSLPSPSHRSPRFLPLECNPAPASVDHHTAQSFNLTSPHFDVRSVAASPLGLGGHGLLPFSPPPPLATSNSSSTIPDASDFAASTHHQHRPHATFYASWSASWSLIRAWVPFLRGENLQSFADSITSSSLPYPHFKTQIRDAWLKINAASARLKLHPVRKHLPTHHRLPSYFDPFLDGKNDSMPEMPSICPSNPSCPSSPNRPRLLIPPNLLNYQSPDRIQSSISAIISGIVFCDLFQSASNSGKSRLLDDSSSQGPSSWLTRMLKSDRFRFLDSGIDPISARAADLLAYPPYLLHTSCLFCSYHTTPALQPLGEDARHYVRSQMSQLPKSSDSTALSLTE